MTASPSGPAGVRARVAARLVGRDRELDLVLAAVAAGRDLVLEGPPGTSKTTLLRAITEEWGIPLLFVEGNADLTPAKLIGHHNPARMLREDYGPANFVDGPLVEAMRRGTFLYIEEFNRTPEDTLNTLLTAMADRRIEIPRVGSVAAGATFRVIASMNPYDDLGTARLSTSVHDRLCRLAIGYQDDEAERGIVALRAGAGPDGPYGTRLIGDAVALTRATREHRDVRQGSSVRGAIDLTLVARELAALRAANPVDNLPTVGTPTSPPKGEALYFNSSGSEGADASANSQPVDNSVPVNAAGRDGYPGLVYDAMIVALSGRIHLDEAAETTPEAVLAEIWADRFTRSQAEAAPG